MIDVNKEIAKKQIEMECHMFGESIEYKKKWVKQQTEATRLALILNQNLIAQALINLANSMQGATKAIVPCKAITSGTSDDGFYEGAFENPTPTRMSISSKTT